ncbi:MAG: class SAM-dependent methyltransferase [Paenibacillus sp.]|jgi:SAM-dependent methyltransferase|nr:class SAM-dependent methyltransferase [Paenibacillus sp.]
MAGFLYPVVSALIIGAVFLAMLSIVYRSWRNGISPMPSSAPVRRAVADEVNRLAGRSKVVEAGSGWGTLALHLARRCPGKQLIGIENSPVPLWISRLAARLMVPEASESSSGSSIMFIRGDIYSYPYEDADIVVCYLYPGAMKRLSQVFERRLAPGAQVISICFALPGWRPERVVTCGDLYRTKVYVYAVEGNRPD